MDFLEYGIKNENSRLPHRRLLAKALLAYEKRRADRYEARLEKMPFEMPEEDGEEMLKRILEKTEE